MSLLDPHRFNSKHAGESDRVNVGEEDEFVLEGYVPSLLRLALLVILSILSGGILVILFSWRPSLKARISNRRCSLEQARLLILRASRRHRGLEAERCSVIYSQVEGATSSEAALKLDLYGSNSIEIEVRPLLWLIIDEFATCILLLSAVSVATHVWQTRKQSIALREQVQSASSVQVIRDGNELTISSVQLVPGDVLVLPRHSAGTMLECDAVLMTGSCIVDESMLTGESVPTPKVALVEDSSSFYSPALHKSNTLFSGTRVLTVQGAKESQGKVKAVVVRTGFATAKGELARSILFPLTANNNLKKQLIKMSAIFFVIGIPCMAYTVYALSRFKYASHDIFIIVLDVATFLIPPVLPAVLTSINVHAQRRLKTKDIYCLNPRMISCSGEVDVMCFDKTGTLTDDTIEFAGVVPVSDGHFEEMQTDLEQSNIDDHAIVRSMAACNSLVEYEDKVEGDDLDLKLFTVTGWKFTADYDAALFEKAPERVVTSGSGAHTVAIMKQFPFESFLQRMLVIVRDTQRSSNVAIVKGAPEIVASFCTSESIPKDFLEVFESYTRRGFRVLATAIKVIPDDGVDMSRSEIECQMEFVGLFLFKNKLKEATFDVLQELRRANIRCIMATGDSLLTGISVAEECQLVDKSDAIIRVRAHLDKSSKKVQVQYSYIKYPDFVLKNDNNANFEQASGGHFRYHFAIEGDSFNTIRAADSQLIERIVHKGTIFARMSPDQKLSLVNLLQKQNHNVGMCGDGANDCGALRAADAGIALSVAEASVASPFTFKQKDISCVPSLLKEGRCTLAAIFGAFKYQVCYCFILLGTVLILFWHGTKPAEGTYVFVDIILNILPPMLFGTTKPFRTLVPTMPFRNILSAVPQLSMYSFILVQVAIYYYVSRYEPMKPNLNNIMEPPTNHLAYAVFSANMMSYVISAIIFAPGPPYRESFFSNTTLIAPSFLIDYLQFNAMPFDFRLKIFLISMGNFVFSFIWEKIFLEQVLRQAIVRLKRRLKVKSSKRFKAIEEEIKAESWPFNNVIASERHRKDNEPNAVGRQLTRFSSEDRL
ncbi:hypothetical protein TYRP_000470 [Tyrophagus putrescentiae]|nr:hypothetical protein TYRP_000470 [Tyrophagus putrescentiae]